MAGFKSLLVEYISMGVFKGGQLRSHEERDQDKNVLYHTSCLGQGFFIGELTPGLVDEGRCST